MTAVYFTRFLGTLCKKREICKFM